MLSRSRPSHIVPPRLRSSLVKGVLASLLALPMLATSTFGTAHAHDGPGQHVASGLLDGRPLPVCDASGVLADIVEKAGYRGQSPYQEPVAITGFDRIHQTRHIGSLGLGQRERRWCRARAHLASGEARTVYYLIESTASFVGLSYGVASCMAGRDLWNVYGCNCTTLRAW